MATLDMGSTPTEYAKTKHVDAFMGEPNLFLLFGFLVLCSLAPTFVPLLGRRLAACLTMRNRSTTATHAANVAAAERHMRAISPVSDFADYVRAKREYDRLRTEHESERSEQKTSSLKLTILCRVLVALPIIVAFIFMLYVRFNATVASVPHYWLYPISNMIGYYNPETKNVDITYQTLIGMVFYTTHIFMR